MKAEPKQFNIAESLPNVLLVGNGILKSAASLNKLESGDWGEKILELSDNPEKYQKSLQDVPYSIQATIVGDYEDGKPYINSSKRCTF